ncbi:biotin-dependent carboxyltransferase family protein [Alcaligenaceae bacterium B3P038]|nr:biotin-dependent carboxyltransferase family protein [Alcaligenaceae bacterium B3P038]
MEVLSSGALNLVQDLGRTGLLSQGISGAGAMDRPALTMGNLLVGNPEDAAGIEISIFPFRVRFRQVTTFACTGAVGPVTLDDRAIPPWWTLTAQPGQTLVVAPPTHGARAYLSVRGGIDTPVVLNSRSTDIKAGFGGLEGRGLKRGDLLPVGAADDQPALQTGIGVVPAALTDYVRELERGEVAVRVLPGAEYLRYTEAARDAFTHTPFAITPDANRMGYRLSGATLALAAPLELLSHGIVPGTIQVPPAGQPIIQLADANTCGGYPKIANVIGADLWRVAQAPIGTRLRFSLVSPQQAAEALQAQAYELNRIRGNLAHLRARG